MSQSPEIKVRSVPMLLSPFVELGRQFVDILRNPTAFFGSLVGSALLTGGVAALVMFGPTFEVSAEDDGEELDMEFMPGELVRLGPKLDPTQIPEKIIVAEMQAAEQATETKVTTEEKIAPKDEKKNEPKKTDKKSTEKPDPDKKNAKVGEKNQDKNTPHNDLPTVDQLPGDPFGDPGGWSDTFKEGDPWATEVMKVLNGLEVGSYAGEAIGGEYQFRLKVCPDGKIEAQTKVSSGNTNLDNAIRNEIARKKVSVPKKVSDLLKGKCQTIKYQFTWKGKQGGKGTVK